MTSITKIARVLDAIGALLEALNEAIERACIVDAIRAILETCLETCVVLPAAGF